MNPINLPIEIKNKIINYTNVVTFYKGKYYNKISKSDKRYELLKKVIKLPAYSYNKAEYYDEIKLLLYKNIGESYNTPRLLITLFIYKSNIGETKYIKLHVSKIGFKFYKNIFILDKQNKWFKTIDYSM
jgi:hypothetical protein